MKEEILSKSHNTNKTKYKQIGRKQSSTIKDIDDKEIRNLLKKVPRDLIEMKMLILKRNKIMWEKFDKGKRSFLDFEDKRIYLYSLISVIVINILIYYLINNGIIDPEINSDSYLFMIIIQSIFLFISFGIIFSPMEKGTSHLDLKDSWSIGSHLISLLMTGYLPVRLFPSIFVPLYGIFFIITLYKYFKL